MSSSGRTRVTIAHRALGVADPLLETVREASAGMFEVYGEMGRGRDQTVVYLAKELESGRLVALTLQPDPKDPAEYTLDVARQLDKSMPAPASTCLHCRAPLQGWGQFCTSCGADVAGSGEVPADAAERQEMLHAVKAATEGEYEILGEMDRAEGRGVVYFARDLETGEITALRLKKEKAGTAEEEYSLGKTRVLKPLVQSLGGGPERRSAPRVAPPPTEPPAASTTARAAPPRRAARSPTPWLTPARLRLTGIVLGAVALVALLVVVWLGRETGTAAALPADTASVAGQAVPQDSTGFLLVATTLPDGAVLEIGGAQQSGRLLELGLGKHEARITADGYQTFIDTVELTQPGRTVEWAPRLSTVASRPTRTARPAPKPSAPPPSRKEPAAAQPTSCATAYLAKSWELAVTLCNAEAARGESFAQRILGAIFESGLAGTVDLKQAASWYKKAADQGDAEAMYRLALMTLDGRGVKRSEKDGMNLLRKAAASGSAQAAAEIKRRQ